jgi:hypothetical protein
MKKIIITAIICLGLGVGGSVYGAFKGIFAGSTEKVIYQKDKIKEVADTPIVEVKIKEESKAETKIEIDELSVEERLKNIEDRLLKLENK